MRRNDRRKAIVEKNRQAALAIGQRVGPHRGVVDQQGGDIAVLAHRVKHVLCEHNTGLLPGHGGTRPGVEIDLPEDLVDDHGDQLGSVGEVSVQRGGTGFQPLRQQLGEILETRETARGLIMSMSDVEFGFNKFNLKPDAQVKLAKISGILLAYPGLRVQVNGYTDNIGSDEYNQKLSEERADGVRDFLVTEGVATTNISAAGYGKTDPVADNSTASGRAENRRVEVVRP